MQNSQLIPFVLPSNTFGPGATYTVPLDSLPKKMNGLIMHVVNFAFTILLIPTFSSGVGTVVGDNNAVASMQIQDGVVQRFSGSLNELRNAERMQLGQPAYPDETLSASASLRAITREFFFGPRNHIGAPSDYLMPCANLIGSSITALSGSLAQIDALCTAAPGTVMRTVAWLYGLSDELRIPSVYEVRVINASGPEVNIPGNFGWDFIALYKPTYAALANGDYGNILVDFGSGPIMNNMNAVDLGRKFVSDKGARINTFTGEPAGATDVGVRSVNETTPTALQVADNDLQPVVWSPPDMKLSKIHISAGNTRLTWSGTQTSANLLVGRFLPQTEQSLANYIARALSQLPDKTIAGQKVKTLKGKVFQGPAAPYMPTTLKLKAK